MPVADYVARLVEQDCVGDHAASAHDRAWLSIIGIGNSGGSDVAGLKDEYLGEAVEADYP